MSEKSPVKILFIGYDASLSGAPVIGLSLLKWLQDKYKIQVDVVLRYGGPLLGEYEQLAPTFVWNKRPKILGIKITRQFMHRRFLKTLKETRYDVVFANSVASSRLAYTIKTVVEAPLIVWIHELRQAINIYWTTDFKDQFTAICDRFITVSEFAKLNLTQNFGIDPDKILLTYGFLPEFFPVSKNEVSRQDLSIPDQAFLIGFSGIGYWWKSFELLPLLVKNVLRNGCDIDYHFLWIGGDKKDIEYVRMMSDAQKLGIQDRIHVVETVPNPERYYVLFDVFVLLSREDTFPLVGLENAYLGKPILCFDQAGGMPEFVQDDAGFVVPFLDLRELADKLIYLSKNKPEADRLGVNAQLKIKQQFNIENSASKIFDLIRSVSSWEL